MKRIYFLAFLLLCTMPVFADDSTQAADGYGAKVSFTYAPIDPGYLGVETLGPMNDPNVGPRFIYSPV